MSTVDAVLSARGTFSAMLEASDFETQLLNSHQALNRFLLEPANIGAMLDILITSTPEPTTYMRASGIARADELSTGLLAAIVNDAALMKRFDSLFARAPSTVAHGVGFTCLGLLLQIATAHLTPLLLYVEKDKSNSTFASRIGLHASHVGVGDLLTFMLTADQTGRASRLFAASNLVSNIVDSLLKSGPVATCTADHINQCELLNLIVKADLEAGRPLATAPLVQQLCETKNINRFFAYALTPGIDEVNRAEAACPTIATLLRRCIAPTPAHEAAAQTELPSVVQVAITHVGDIVNVLRGYKKVKYFGCHRLQFVELLASLSHTNYSNVHRVMVEQKAYSVLFDIFFERIWLNFVHRIVAEMVETLAQRAAKSRRVIVHFLKHLSVHRRCAEAALVGADRAVSVRTGTMGYVVRVANALATLQGSHSEIDETFQSEPKWAIFVKTELVARNELDRTPLAQRVAQRNGGPVRNNQYGTMKFDPDGAPPPIPDSLPPPKPPRGSGMGSGMSTADPRQLQAAVAAMRNSGGIPAAAAAGDQGVLAFASGRTHSEMSDLKAEEERIKAAFAEKQAEEARKKEKKRLKKAGQSERERKLEKAEKKAKKEQRKKEEEDAALKAKAVEEDDAEIEAAAAAAASLVENDAKTKLDNAAKAAVAASNAAAVAAPAAAKPMALPRLATPARRGGGIPRIDSPMPPRAAPRGTGPADDPDDNSNANGAAEADNKQKADDEAASKKRADEEAAKRKAAEDAAAKKKAEDEAAATKKKADEAAAAAAAAAAAKKTADDEAAAKKKADEAAAAKKKADDEAAAKKKSDEAAAAKKKADDEAAAKKKADDDAAAAAKKKADEAAAAAAAKKKADEEAAKKKADEEAAAAAKKKADDEAAAAKKKADDEAAAAKKKADEEAAAKRKADEEAAAKKKADEEAAAAAAKKKAEVEAAAKKEAEADAAAAKKKADDEAAAAAKKADDEAAAKKEAAAAQKKADEEAAAAAKKKADDEAAAAKKKADDDAAAAAAAKKKADEESAAAVAAAKKAAEEAAAKKKAEDDAAAAAKKKADEEAAAAAAAAKKKADDEATAAIVAKRKADEEAAAAKKKADEEAAAKRRADDEAAATAKKKADEEAAGKRKADEEAATAKRLAEEEATRKAEAAAQEAEAESRRASLPSASSDRTVGSKPLLADSSQQSSKSMSLSTSSEGAKPLTAAERAAATLVMGEFVEGQGYLTGLGKCEREMCICDGFKVNVFRKGMCQCMHHDTMHVRVYSQEKPAGSAGPAMPKTVKMAFPARPQHDAPAPKPPMKK